MSTLKNKEAQGSPMEEVIVWATPREETGFKRKCNDDSGYASCSKSSNVLDTPNGRNAGLADNENVFTPSIKPVSQGIKKNIFHKPEDKTMIGYNNCTLPVIDSYSDFLIDTSLYSEPMETSGRESALCMITEEPDETLTDTEISKKIDVNLEIESCTTPKSPKKRFCSPFKKKYARQRSLHGFEKVDILFQLGERKNYSLIVSLILSYLSDNDLSNVTMVSSTWRNICLKDPKARARWYKHIEYLKERKENLRLSNNKLKRTQTPLRSRNHSTPLHVRQERSPPVSPSKFRFHLFQKEARTLKDDEILMECPRCSRPSACSPSTLIGECRALACMLKFCTVCRTPVQERHECPFLTPVTPTKRTHTAIGSKKSKRFLRRL